MIASVVVGFCFGEGWGLVFSSVEARRRFFDCCGFALVVFLPCRGEGGDSGVQFVDEGEDVGETSYDCLDATFCDETIDPRAGGGRVNASSRDERLGGGFGGRSTED